MADLSWIDATVDEADAHAVVIGQVRSDRDDAVGYVLHKDTCRCDKETTHWSEDG